MVKHTHGPLEVSMVACSTVLLAVIKVVCSYSDHLRADGLFGKAKRLETIFSKILVGKKMELAFSTNRFGPSWN